MSEAAHSTNRDHAHADADSEQLALAAIDAIKRLIAERNGLRSRITVLEHELVRLRDHSNLIRESYRKLANELITQLQLVDKFDSEIARGSSGGGELHWLRGEQKLP